MNRRAKRQKYRRMEQKYKNEIRGYLTRDALMRSCTEIKREIRTISVLFHDDFSTALANSSMNEIQKQIAAHRIADEIIKHKEFVKVTDTGYGILCQLDIVLPKEL